MAIVRKLNVRLCHFPYAGTSTGTSLCYDLVPWSVHVAQWCSRDSRVNSFDITHYAETPITMTRNEAVSQAKRDGVDILVMADSDMSPDCELKRDPEAVPFFPRAFDFLYKNWEAGPHVVAAPYCGPPPSSRPYIFRWASEFEGLPDQTWRLEMYGREEAAQMAGIHPAAALPTGLIAFDMRVFDLIDVTLAKPSKGWFYYEWTDATAAHKASTEDVTATRDLSLAGWQTLGRDVLYCDWSAWAGHNKVYCVGKPRPLFAGDVSEYLSEAAKSGRQRDVKLIELPGV